MKKYIWTLLLIGLLAIQHPVVAASRVLFDGFQPTSAGVGPSPSNEPAANDPFRYFQIYLPDGYDESGNDKRYPVVYFLHGFGQNYSSYSGMFAHLDEEIAKGQLSSMIVVKADGSLANGWLGSFFLNSALNGNFEDYIVNELRAYVNSHYRTKTDETGIDGHSMGGYAAILLSIKYPHIYSTVTLHAPSSIIAMAPQVFNPNFYQGMLQEIPLIGPSAGKILPTNGQISFRLFALSAALSPNLAQSPFMVDLPIQVNPDFTPILVNGQLQPNVAVLERWLQNDPYTLVSGNFKVRKQLKHQSLYIDYGQQEALVMTAGVQLFEQLLRREKIPFKSVVCEGSSFAQTELYTPSNDIPESMVHPALVQTTSLLVPDPSQQPKLLVDFVIQAIQADPQQFDATTLANFNGFLTVVCGIDNPPTTTGDLLVDPDFLSCLESNGIDPEEFVSDYFEIPGFISIDPIRFGIDTDGFVQCCKTSKKCSINCPARLFQSFKKRRFDIRTRHESCS